MWSGGGQDDAPSHLQKELFRGQPRVEETWSVDDADGAAFHHTGLCLALRCDGARRCINQEGGCAQDGVA